MIDQGFFLTLAGMSMSFAGFAGLMNALRRRGDSWAPLELYQLRIIVAYATATLFASLLTIPFTDLLGPTEGLRWLGVVMLVLFSVLGLGNMLSDIRGDHGAVVSTRVRAIFTTITIFGLLALVGVALTGSQSLYRMALILMLGMPAGTYVYVIARLER